MLYTSTRDRSVKVSSAQAIAQGISADGGLFVPESIPQITMDEIVRLSSADYVTRAKEILSLYLTDFTEEELDYCVNGAYASGRFSSEKVAPLAEIEPNVHLLELWKGPTCAFKDMALQLLPYLMTVSAKKTADGKTIVILVATSGDTGKAALEGFKDVKDTKILVFYPEDGVSPMQKLQMMTQEGDNVGVCAIRGNFDDAQSGVKRIFSDRTIAEKMAAHNMMFSSANSINWGRLVPQIVYYISAYCDMIADGSITPGAPVNVAVPTGNFGNILAAYYARKMGLPINKLICASNANNVLTDFLATGVYDRNRTFHATISPSMDILISSNLERLLYDMTDGDDRAVAGYMEQLNTAGRYTVAPEVFAKISALFCAGCCDDAQTKQTIHQVFESDEYLCDTHTAVAVKVYKDYCERTGDQTDTIIASTANPFKFSAAVLEAVGGGLAAGLSEFDVVRQLSVVTGEQIPAPLADLEQRGVRFTDVCDKEDMAQAVFKMLGIEG